MRGRPGQALLTRLAYRMCREVVKTLSYPAASTSGSTFPNSSTLLFRTLLST